jgi:hypothetical protein
VSFRKNAIAVASLATLGAAIGWLLSIQDSWNAGFGHSQRDIEHSIERSNIAPLVAPPSIDLISESSNGGNSELRGAPTAEESSKAPSEYPEREVGNSIVSGNAELTINRTLVAKLDRSRYQVQAVMCHEHSCQIFSKAQVSGADSDWPPIVDAIVQDLQAVYFRNSETGAELKPILKTISQGRRQDAVTVTIIWLQ